MGYKLAGYDVIGNNEIDDSINEMYVKNFRPKYNYHMPIQKMVQLEDFPEDLKNLDVLDGSPPCSTFSVAGLREEAWNIKKKFREGQADQVLSELFFDFIRLADILRPKVVVAENVKGILMGNAKGYMNAILKAFETAGYKAQIFLLNAASMGVPQRRERVFFICRRADLNLPAIRLSFREPPIKYGEFADEEYIPINPATELFRRWSRRAVGDRTIGDTVRRTEGGKISSFSNGYIFKNEVPYTLISCGEMVRFDVPGTVSKRDLCAIQTFPQDYDFCGQSVKYVCGMSVPPVMMKKIAKQIEVQMLKGGRTHGAKVPE